jgi:uridine kinase
MHKKPFLIGVAGPSCSGKSEVSRLVAGILHAPVFGLDAYYFDLAHLPMEERVKVNFDSPDSMDATRLVADVQSLASGHTVDKPVYDFAAYTPSARTERVEPAEYVIVEGLFALHWPALRDLLDLKIFLQASHDVCLARRLERDVRERGRTPECVRQQYESNVRPMCDLYVRPTLEYADVVLDGAGLLDHSVHRVMDVLEVRSAHAACA